MIMMMMMMSVMMLMKYFSGLLSHYGPGHHDYTDTNMALSKVKMKSFIL